MKMYRRKRKKLLPHQSPHVKEGIHLASICLLLVALLSPPLYPLVNLVLSLRLHKMTHHLSRLLANHP
jgi:hypothetical protein